MRYRSKGVYSKYFMMVNDAYTISTPSKLFGLQEGKKKTTTNYNKNSKLEYWTT